MYLPRFFLICLFCLSFNPTLQGKEKPLASADLVQALTQEVSGEIAYRYTVSISQYDRIQASNEWHSAAEMIKQELEKIGYQNAVLEGWPSNGSRYYYTYQTPIGWSASEGELWMVSPQKERLTSFEEVPLTLVKHSNSADVEAELIDVGTGVGDDSYQNRDVRGKIVLATAYTGSVMREAVVKRGALGVITWYPPEVRPGYPNMIRYTAIWPTWEEKDQIGFGFNVSKQQGWRLKQMLDNGQKVILKAQVKAEYYDKNIDALSCSIPGTVEPEKELLLIGHLCHPTPSANDNASGAAGLMEMARALKRMIDKGLVAQPRRTIRFLWVPEFYGTIPYIKAHLERTRNTLAVINCDMIGEDLHLTGGKFTITQTPDSIPSFLNDVVVNFARLVESMGLQSLNGSRHPFAVQVNPYGGGSDHLIFNDSAIKVPAVMFGHGDTFHHTSLDTPDKVDPSELRRVCFTALGAMYYLAQAGENEAREMAQLIARNGLARLSNDYYDSLNSWDEADNGQDLYAAYFQTRNVITHSGERERAAILSTRKFSSNPAVADKLHLATENLKAVQKIFETEVEGLYVKKAEKLGVQPQSISLSPDEERLNQVVVIRSDDFVAPLQTGYLVDKLGEEAVENIKLSGNIAYEALNLVDGRRSILEIQRAVSAEYSPVPVTDFADFFKVLEMADLVSLDEK